MEIDWTPNKERELHIVMLTDAVDNASRRSVKEWFKERYCEELLRSGSMVACVLSMAGQDIDDDDGGDGGNSSVSVGRRSSTCSIPRVCFHRFKTVQDGLECVVPSNCCWLIQSQVSSIRTNAFQRKQRAKGHGRHTQQTA